MSNVEFSYLYRDGGNFKKFGRVVFSNPDRIDCSAIEVSLRQAFWDDLFVAHQVRLPEVFIYLHSPFSFDDHCYHEFEAVRVTGETPNDEHGRTIMAFLSEVSEEDRLGWEEFDPYDSRSRIGQIMAG